MYINIKSSVIGYRIKDYYLGVYWKQGSRKASQFKLYPQFFKIGRL